MEKTTWTRSEILNLIKVYKAHPVLWDSNHEDFRQQHIRAQAWESIGERFSLAGNDTRQKMNSLLSSFRRKQKSAKATRHSGASSWFAYEPMSFLLHVKQKQQQSHRRVQEAHEAEEEIEGFVITVKSDTPESSYTVCSTRSTERLAIGQSDVTLAEPEQVDYHSVANTSCTLPLVAEDAMGAIVNSTNKCSCVKDEWSSYAEYVAFKLRKLDGRARILAQHDINNILFEAEMQKFGNLSSAT